jgi:general secretion pathway protein C
MLTTTPSSWTVRGTAFALWLLVAASAVYWGLKLAARPAAVSAPAPGRATVAVDPGAVARLLGGAPVGAVAAAPSLASRFSLVGVVAGARSGGGAAVISVDGKAAKPFRVGSAVDENLVVRSVEGRRAVLGAPGEGPPALTLELPPPRK